MERTSLELQPTSVPEWDAEDAFAGVLAGETLVKADEAQAREMLDEMTLNLPQQLAQTELVAYAAQRRTPLGLLPADSARYDFHLVEVPLNILIAERLRLVRLRLRLELHADGAAPEQAVAYDLYPKDESDQATILSGSVSLDVSKALKFALTAIPAAGVAAPLADCLGLKLDLPFKWTSTYAQVQTTDRLSNPLEWYVTDKAIQNGFTAGVIIQSPKGSAVSVTAALACELRRAGLLGHILKAQYEMRQRVFPLQKA